MARSMAGRSVYQPANEYAEGDKLVFPALDFAQGKVTAVRDGHNPRDGVFQVVKVKIASKEMEFAAKKWMQGFASIFSQILDFPPTRKHKHYFK